MHTQAPEDNTWISAARSTLLDLEKAQNLEQPGHHPGENNQKVLSSQLSFVGLREGK